MDDPKVSIVILNWNGVEDTIECLESLYQIKYRNYDVIVVDNNSRDNSVRMIKNYVNGEIKVKSNFFDYNYDNKPIKTTEYTREESLKINKKVTNGSNEEKLTIIKNEKNYGFPEGNNVGIRYALKNLNPDYILLLNNDIVVDQDFLKELVDAGESNEKIGILGPKIYYYHNPQVIWSAGCKISWKLGRGVHMGEGEVDKGQYEEKKEFGYVNGSAFLIKTEVIHKIGLLDKKFFLYFEESDFALRALQARYKSLYVPKAKVWHKISRSGGGITKPIGLYYITRNRWILMKKWAGKSDYFFFILYQIAAAILFPLFLSIYYKNRELFKAYYKGLLDGFNS
jgi:GT2 family glycosyltransferase